MLVGTVTTQAPPSISTCVQLAPTVHLDLTSQLHVQPEPTPVWITMELSLTVSTVQLATTVMVTSSSNKANYLTTFMRITLSCFSEIFVNNRENICALQW